MLNSTSKPYQVKTKKYVSLYLFLVCLILLTLPACGGGGGDAGVESEIGTHEIPMETIGLKKEWSFSTGNKIYSSPAIAQDGTIYIGSNDGYLYALDPNRTLIWPPFQTGGGIFSSPTIGDDGIIYVGSNDKNLYAIYPDGTQKWFYPTKDKVLSTPALDHNGIIYVGSNDGNLYAITSEKEEKWSVALGGWVSSPIIGEDNTIYVGAGKVNLNYPGQSTGRLYALEPDNGVIKWKTEFNVSSRPAIGSDGTIYAGSTNNNLYALDPDDGTEIWKYTTGGPILSCPKVLEGETDIIIIGSDDKNLYAFNSDGGIIWSAQLGEKIRSSAGIGPDGTIYIGCHDKCLHAFDAEDGAPIGYFPTRGYITSIPAVSEDGTIYFGSQDSKIYALTRITGENKNRKGRDNNVRI